MGHLVSALTSVRKQEGELKLLLTNNVNDVAANCEPEYLFDIMDNEAAAVDSFG